MSPIPVGRLGAMVVVILLGGCRSEGDTVGKTALTRAVMDTTPVPDAIDEIVTRRCRSAAVCATKLNDATFHLDACNRMLRSHLELVLDRSTNCPEDVDHHALTSCLAALDHDACSRAMASVDEVMACRHSELCAQGFPAPLQ